MKVAIVHDWLTNYGGAETFVELWLRMYPYNDPQFLEGRQPQP